MLHSVIFIMAFPGEMIKSRSLIRHIKHFILLLLNSMAAGCLQFLGQGSCSLSVPQIVQMSMQKLTYRDKNVITHIYTLYKTTWSSGYSIDRHHRSGNEEWHLGCRCSTTEALPHHCLTAQQQQVKLYFLELLESLQHVKGTRHELSITTILK